MSYFEGVQEIHHDRLSSSPLDFTSNSCTNLTLIQHKLSNWLVVLSVILLVIINVMVIFGNILVILSVFISQKLRTSTNYFIVSLAVADLLVGIAVLPYSLTLEVLDIWIFGSTWCQGWLVVDVWMCTASILNLCAISVDRYLAVTRPVRYRSLMTSSRAKQIILAVWILSFLICFPQLVGLNGAASPLNSTSNTVTVKSSGAEMQVEAIITPRDDEDEEDGERDESYAHSANLTAREKTVTDVTTNFTTTCQLAMGATSCKLFDQKGYVIYSALGSFWCPMVFMIFFYWRIYRVALSSTRALERGYKSTKGNKSVQGQGGSSCDERFTLRMHRGLPCEPSEGSSSHQSQQQQQQQQGQAHEQQQQQQSLSHSLSHSLAIQVSCEKKERDNSREKVTCAAVNSSFLRWKSKPTIIEPSVMETHMDSGTTGAGAGTGNTSGTTRVSQLENNCELLVSSPARGNEHLAIRRSDLSSGNRNRLSPSASVHSNLGLSPCSSRAGSARSSAASARASRRSNPGKLQLRRLKAETKAAKTVSFIVGGFIICWFPFFTAYLARAFCDKDCVNPFLMSVFTWLGYLNSGINPIIYGLFSRDFRKSFKQIVCKCVCTPAHDTGVSSLIRNIHMPTFLDEEAAK